MSDSTDNAIENAAAAEAAAAEQVSDAAKAAAAKDIAEGAAAAATAAQSAATLYETKLAEDSAELKETVKWLKLNAEQTGSSLATLAERQQQMESSLPKLFEQTQASIVGEVKSLLLTPPQSPAQPVNPAMESEKEGGRKEKNAAAEAKPKPKQGPKYKANWM